MLVDLKEIEIISRARQKNVRDPNRSRKHFENIFEDFFKTLNFHETCVMDLGPGQYDFCVIAEDRGAAQCHAIDNDPAVIELGRHKGFEVRDSRLQDLDPSWFKTRFDGLFCKFSINAFWFYDDLVKLADYVTKLDAILSTNGWAWIAPWNGIPKSVVLSPSQIEAILDTQIEIFKKLDYKTLMLTRDQVERYGVNGLVANNPLFIKGI